MRERIAYKATKKEFLEDYREEKLIKKIIEGYLKCVGKPTNAIISSWNNSLPYLYFLLEDNKISDDIGISIEQAIPNIDTRKRMDVMITGRDKNKRNVAIILELKQWSKVEETADRVGYIVTGPSKEKSTRIHPSTQAVQYTNFLKRYNNAILEKDIKVFPVAYLHNYDKKTNDLLFSEDYKQFINKCPIFVRGEVNKLREFICDKIHEGDNCEIIDIIDNSDISIPRLLEIGMPNMMKEPEGVILIDEQELIYEKAIKMAMKSKEDNKKRIIIVKGGTGTGKSILAMKLLVDITMKLENKEDKKNIENKVNYITPILKQREVYIYSLKNHKNHKIVQKEIKSPGTYIKAKDNEKDVLIIDEAHRLKEKSGRYQMGENQTKEIIKASKFSIFFIDDLQRITIKDKGNTEEIIKIAKEQNAEIEICELTSQFRCNGSASYVSWIEDVLQIRNTANHDGFDSNLNYDIRILDNPNEMRDFIIKKNNRKVNHKIKNASRIVAGYCWESNLEARNDPQIYDIQMPEYNFYMSWNLKNERWAIEEDAVKRAGCIYTCQGFDFEYIGVIIGKDLIYRDGKVKVDYNIKPKSDNALIGIKGLAKKNKEEAYNIADTIIKNTYRVLLTRGQAGCIIFCEDEALRDYFKERLNKINYKKDNQ